VIGAFIIVAAVAAFGFGDRGFSRAFKGLVIAGVLALLIRWLLERKKAGPPARDAADGERR
jgi:hypothetical protein